MAGAALLFVKNGASPLTASMPIWGRAPRQDILSNRINGDGNYEPGNCRWATRREQQRNICFNRHVEINGRRVTLAEAAELAPVSYNTILYRLRRGWTIEDALSRPTQQGVRP